MILGKVDVPASFSAPKSASNTASVNSDSIKTKGWVAIDDKARIPFNQASKICGGKVKAEYRRFIRNYSSNNKSLKCSGNDSSSFSCRSEITGGFWGGVSEHLNEKKWKAAGVDLAKSIALECMVEYGWIKD